MSSLELDLGDVRVTGEVAVPEASPGLVVFAQCGASRSPRDHRLARALQRAGLATLQLDLLTEAEVAVDHTTRHLRFDLRLLTRRLVAAIDEAGAEPGIKALPVGLLAVGTGAAAALCAAAERPARVRAVVARAGRPDLARGHLQAVRAPTLLLVGARDETGLRLNRRAMTELGLDATLHVIPDADDAFEAPGAMHEFAELATSWLGLHLRVDPLG